MITFEAPVFLILAALIPTLFFLSHLWRRRGSYIPFSFTIWRKQSLPKPSFFSRAFVALSSLLYWGALVCLLIALAGPALT